MTHYESKAGAREKDNLALKDILNLAPESLMATVTSREVSMCGSGPAAAMLFAVKTLGAVKAELTMYDTSGTVTGDDNSVVGYAGIIVS
jgi:AmmeMemoRadiSam system protein B